MWNNNLAQTADAVTVLLAGSIPRLQAWYTALAADARFRVAMQASEPQDLRSKLVTNPDVLVLDAGIYPGPQPLLEDLTRYHGAAYVLLPVEASREAMDSIAQIPCVKGVYKGDMNLVALAGDMYAAATAQRQNRLNVGMEALWNRPQSMGGGGQPLGLRVVAVWNQAGGVGKTTIASNLAYEAARRGLPSLLVGMGAPDDLPLIMGLKPEPNLNHWRANPSAEGLKLALQKVDTLDVLAGFPDVLSEARAITTPLDAPESVPKLVLTAAYMGYAAIVLDAPPTALASAALAAANTLVLVARPSLEGVMRTVEAYRTVVERLAGEHHIPASGVYVVLNRMGGRMALDEWHKAASALLGRPFPPVVAQIPDEPRVGEAQDGRRMPLNVSDAFARGLKPLADVLFSPQGAQASQAQANGNGKKAFEIFGVRVKV
jgi:cellulose biosynthesis protein BcsQ